MAPTLPTGIPATLAAGDTWEFELAPGDFPPSEGYTLAVHVRGESVLTWDAAWITDDGAATYTVTIPAASTAAIEPGTYTVLVRATLAGKVYTAGQTTATVTPNVATAVAGDLQSHEEKLIPVLETAIRTRVAADLASYTILGRSATKEELREYRQMLAEARAAVARQQHGGWLPSVEVHIGRA